MMIKEWQNLRSFSDLRTTGEPTWKPLVSILMMSTKESTVKATIIRKKVKRQASNQ
jgi:hypothetical protein